MTSCECLNNVSVNAGNNVTICEGEEVTLQASSGPARYLWNTGHKTRSITVSPLTTTTFFVYGFDNSGCYGKDEVKVTVEPLDCQIPADKTINCTESSDPNNTGQATACHEVIFSDKVISDACPKVIERTWISKDAVNILTTRQATSQGTGPCGTGSKLSLIHI